MKLTSHLPPAERDRVEGRLHSNLIAWLTTMRPDGQPVTVPVWFLLRDDETILLYRRPQTDKLRNIAANPKVSFALNVTDIGRNIVRLECWGAPRFLAPTGFRSAGSDPGNP